jgi:hypothetical protein
VLCRELVANWDYKKQDVYTPDVIARLGKDLALWRVWMVEKRSIGIWTDFRKIRKLDRARVNAIIFGGKDQKLWTQS